MNTFEYIPAPAENAALAAHSATPDSRYVGGGTCLIDLMKLAVETPSRLIDVHRLPLADITATGDGGLRIGAMARNSAVAQDAAVRERYPLLAEATLSGASAQLRNMATVGGNLMQRTRCAYFRDVTQACNKRVPGSGCGADGGYHRGHAVLGTSDSCFATHPSDMCVALLCLEATIDTRGGRHGQRQIPIADFHLLPGGTPHLETVLDEGELIVAVTLPPPAAAWRSRYVKVRDRASYEFALVSVAALVEVAGTRSATSGWDSAASRPGRGGQRRRSRCCATRRPRSIASARRPTRQSPMRCRAATTASRSSCCDGR